MVTTGFGEHDFETGQFWWLPVPGMAWPGQEPGLPAEVANQVCALVCARRLQAILKITNGRSRLLKCAIAAEQFGNWLDGAGDDSHALLWRITLCEVIELAPADSEAKHVIEYAERFLGKGR
jgi:hypothetical protein